MMEEKKLVPKRRFKGFTEDWKQRNLVEVVDFYNEKRIPIDSQKRVKGQYPYYGATGIIDYVEDYIFEGNYVLLAEDGANIIVRNSPISYLTKGKFWVNNHAHVMKMKSGSNVFLVQLLERQNYEKYNSGTAQPKLNGEVVKNISLKFPSVKEQTKIGCFFNQIDNTIALQKRKVEKLKALKSAYLTEMFPQEGESVPKRRFKEFKNSPPWKMSTMREVVDVYDGTHQTPKYTDSGVMFLSVENIRTLKSNKYISQEDFERDFKIFPQTGDVLMTRIGDVGTANIVESDENKAYYVTLALLKKRGLDPYFLKESIHSAAVKRELWHRTLHIAFPKKINMDELGKVKLKYPNIEEQQKIGEFFKNLDDQITTEEKKLEKLKKMKEAYIEEMFV